MLHIRFLSPDSCLEPDLDIAQCNLWPWVPEGPSKKGYDLRARNKKNRAHHSTRFGLILLWFAIPASLLVSAANHFPGHPAQFLHSDFPRPDQTK
ncbi:hypothetical protein D3C77_562540 [compost metagenome]